MFLATVGMPETATSQGLICAHSGMGSSCSALPTNATVFRMSAMESIFSNSCGLALASSQISACEHR